jgi:hypothetical protein
LVGTCLGGGPGLRNAVVGGEGGHVREVF